MAASPMAPCQVVPIQAFGTHGQAADGFVTPRYNPRFIF